MSNQKLIYTRPCTPELHVYFSDICQKVKDSLRLFDHATVTVTDGHFTVDQQEYTLGDVFDTYKELKISICKAEITFIEFINPSDSGIFVLDMNEDWKMLVGAVTEKLFGDFKPEEFPILSDLMSMDMEAIFGFNGKESSLKKFTDMVVSVDSGVRGPVH